MGVTLISLSLLAAPNSRPTPRCGTLPVFFGFFPVTSPLQLAIALPPGHKNFHHGPALTLFVSLGDPTFGETCVSRAHENCLSGPEKGGPYNYPRFIEDFSFSLDTKKDFFFFLGPRWIFFERNFSDWGSFPRNFVLFFLEVRLLSLTGVFPKHLLS